MPTGRGWLGLSKASPRRSGNIVKNPGGGTGLVTGCHGPKAWARPIIEGREGRR